MKKMRLRQLMAYVLIVCMMFTTLSGPLPINAEENEDGTINIVNIQSLPDDIGRQNVALGTSFDNLILPSELEVTIMKELEEKEDQETEEKGEAEQKENQKAEEKSELEQKENQETKDSIETEQKVVQEAKKMSMANFEIDIDPTFQVDHDRYQTLNISEITWESNPVYDGNISEVYTFTPNFSKQYAVVEDVVLPKIEITVLPEEIVEPEVPENPDILIGTLENSIVGDAPYFDGNKLYGNNQAIIITEVGGSIKAFWDKNSDKINDVGDIEISFDTVNPTSLICEDWEIYGGKENPTLDNGFQITILAGKFKSIDGGADNTVNRLAYIGQNKKLRQNLKADNKVNRLAYIGVSEPLVNGADLTNFDQISYEITIDSTNDDETYKVWQPYGENMVELSGGIPVKDSSRFLGYYDQETGGKQYYNDQGKVSNDGSNNAVTYDKKSICTLYGQWSAEKGLFAGRFSSYQVFDCWRSDITEGGKQMFKVHKFASPFEDLQDSGKQMSEEDVKGKIFSFRKSGEDGKPFILYMADDTSGTNARAISRNGYINNLGDEGLLFVSHGSEKGYFLSLSQGFEYGGELTYEPKHKGNINVEDAENAVASPSPWYPDFSCAVVFDSQGAQIVAAPSQISVDKPTTEDVALGYLPSEPLKTGYDFGGWYTREYGQGTKITEETMLRDKSITAYAKWIPKEGFALDISLEEKDNKFTERLLGQASIAESWAGNINVVSGYKVTDIAAVKVGENPIDASEYEYDSASGKMTIKASSMSENIIITVKSKPITYTINYDPNSATGSAIPVSQNVTYGEEALFASKGDMKLVGKTFKGWAKRKHEPVVEYTEGASITANDTDTLNMKDGGSITLYAVWEENSAYTVSYDTDGGSIIDAKKGVKWTEKNLLPSGNPTKNGYTFKEWKYNEKTVKLADSYGTLAPNDTDTGIEIKAVWEEKSAYTVKYNTGNGTSIGDKANVKWTGTNLLPTDVLTKKGYTFDKWQYNGSDVASTNSYKDIAKDDTILEITLTAVWKENSAYTVNYDTDGGSAIEAKTDVKWTQDNLLPSKNPTKEGYTFEKWQHGENDVKASDSYGSLAPNDTDTGITFKAVWKETTYTVKYNTGNESSISDKADVKWIDTNLLPTDVLTKKGYTFGGWQYNGSDVASTNSYKDIAKDDTILEITLTAVWKENSAYTVSYDTDGGSAVADKINVRWTQGNLIPSENPTKEGFSFEGWYYGAIRVLDDTTISTLIPLDDKKSILLEATWKVKPGDGLDISGTVEDENGEKIVDAKVKLTQGNIVIYGPTTTNKQGEYILSDLKPGIYNLVATRGTQEVTVIITISNSDLEQILVLPLQEKNSVLDVKGTDTPTIVVGNLDEIAKKSEIGSGNISLTVKLTVEKLTEDEGDKQKEIIAIRDAAGKNANMLLLDAILTKQIDNNQPVDIGNNNDTVLEIVIPYDFTNKKDVKVYRYHDEVNVFRELSAKPHGKYEDQTYYLDKAASLIHVYAKRYSVYAVAYSDVTGGNKPNTGGSNNGGNSSPKPEEKPSQKLPTETGASNWFNVESHYGYVVGNTDGLLHPEDNITRGEVAAIFYSLLRSDIRSKYETADNPFGDVSAIDWYNNAISTLFNAGIIKGMPDGNFAPNQYITRGEFAAIAAQFASEVYNGEDLFTDISGHWAKTSINRAASYGWVNGVGNGEFLPERSITRAEAISLVNTVLGRVPKNLDSLVSGMKTWQDNQDTSNWYYLALQEATNGHIFVRTEDKVTENWTKLLS